MPKKMRRAAIKSCLTDKAANNHLYLLQRLEMDKPQTKDVLRTLTSLGLSRSTLLVTKEADQMVVRSARNIPWVRTLPANLLNVGDLVRHGDLVMTVDAVRRAEEIWGRPQDVADMTEEGK
jgi:large subunit ribosomal protein L4